MWYVDSIGLVKTPRGVTIDGIQHPRNIFTLWSKADLAAIGIKPASITSVDSRYSNTGALTWDTSGAEAVGTYATTDVDAAALKTTMTDSVQSQAGSFLAGSDWYAIREAEGGTACPADWKTWRAAIRTESNSKVTAIAALADLDAIKAFDDATPITSGWPNDPNYVAP